MGAVGSVLADGSVRPQVRNVLMTSPAFKGLGGTQTTTSARTSLYASAVPNLSQDMATSWEELRTITRTDPLKQNLDAAFMRRLR
jgi:hypothetical protein